MEPADVVKNCLRYAAHEPVLCARALSLHQPGIDGHHLSHRPRRARGGGAGAARRSTNRWCAANSCGWKAAPASADYSGAAQHIPVTLNGQSGTYTHNMYLDVYAPISAGRELWGFPQKLAKPRLAVEHDTLVGTLDYGPVEVARGTMGYKHRPFDRDAARADVWRARLPAQDHSACRRQAADLRAGSLLPATTSSCTAPGPARAHSPCIRTRWRR